MAIELLNQGSGFWRWVLGGEEAFKNPGYEDELSGGCGSEREGFG